MSIDFLIVLTNWENYKLINYLIEQKDWNLDKINEIVSECLRMSGYLAI